MKMQAAIIASRFFPLSIFSSVERLYNCFAMSMIVFGSERRSHQLEMSRNACMSFRSERDGGSWTRDQVDLGVKSPHKFNANRSQSDVSMLSFIKDSVTL